MNDPVSQQAANWIDRRSRGLTVSEARDLAAWLQIPLHRSAYAQLEQTWTTLDRIGESKLASVFSSEVSRLERPSRTRVPLFRYALAAAAALVIGLGTAATWRYVRAHGAYTEVASTLVGEFRQLELPDGSTIHLNTDSSVEVAYTKTERRIRLLQGEALFSVAKQSDRVFVVGVRGVDVRAVGTAFNVRVQTGAVEVLVTEGRVRVDDASRGSSLLPPALPDPSATSSAFPNQPVLSAGQKFTVVLAPATEPSPAPTVVTVAAPEITRALAWQDRRVVFSETPLSEIAAEFNRYNRQKLVIADPELAARHFDGTFAAGETRTFVELLQASYHVQVEETPDTIVLRSQRD